MIDHLIAGRPAGRAPGPPTETAAAYYGSTANRRWGDAG